MRSTRSFWKAGHLPTLVSAFLYFDVSFMVWVLLGALGNYIAADFGLSPAEKGLMTAIPLLAGSVLRLLFGYLTDTIGAKNTGCLGLALTLAPLMAGWQWADSLGKVYLAGLQQNNGGRGRVGLKRSIEGFTRQPALRIDRKVDDVLTSQPQKPNGPFESAVPLIAR